MEVMKKKERKRKKKYKGMGDVTDKRFSERMK